MDVVVNKDKMMDISSLPGMESIPKTGSLPGLNVSNTDDEELNTYRQPIEMKSSQTVVNEAPSSVQFSKANESVTTGTPQIKQSSSETVSQNTPVNTSEGGNFLSISSCISFLIMFIIAGAIAYYLYSNPEMLNKLTDKLPIKK